MRSVVVSNMGANLGVSMFDRLGIVVTPVTMMADGQSYDTRNFRTTSDIDALIERSKTFPHILGSSAGELLPVFNVLRETYDEIVVVTTSRNSISTHTAAVAAMRTLKSVKKDVNMHVIDSGTVDLGVGLIVLFTLASLKAGYGGERLVTAAERLGKSGRFVFTPLTLDYLVKSGRANVLAAQAAELFNRRVLLGHVEGQNQKLGTFSKNQDPVTVIADDLVDNIGKGRAVWAAVMHGNNQVEADRLAERLRQHFDVRFLMNREISAGVYMSVGKGALGAYVTPVGELPWPVDLGALAR